MGQDLFLLRPMCWLSFAERLPYSFRQALVALLAHPCGKRFAFLFGLGLVSCPPIARLGYILAFVHSDTVICLTAIATPTNPAAVYCKTLLRMFGCRISNSSTAFAVVPDLRFARISLATFSSASCLANAIAAELLTSSPAVFSISFFLMLPPVGLWFLLLVAILGRLEPSSKTCRQLLSLRE